MTVNDFVPSKYLQTVTDGSITWKSPSNIALVKYWGKLKDQIPANPSISFTLDSCTTTTTILFVKLKERADDFDFNILLDGELAPDFKPKIKTFFSRIEKYMPFLKDFHFTIQTSNSFPHSSGIASSASGMSALALCLLSLEEQIGNRMDPVFFNQKASFLARLGSGSACRSIYGGLVGWGVHKNISESSNLYGVAYDGAVHSIFKNYQDTILLVDKGQKQVSSSVGHNLMHNHPFAEARFQQAHSNLEKLQEVLKKGDLDAFITIVESEALTLHSMMMASQPYFILMKANTLKIINKIWEFRAETGCKLCFTLDAGANVHVLFPDNEKARVDQFIKDELVKYCENSQFICDRVGSGAKKG